MNKFLLLSSISVFLCASLSAATIITRDARFEGEIQRQNEKEIVLKPQTGAEIALPREQILTVYDSDGNLLWSHPSIIPNDKGANEKLELTNADAVSRDKKTYISLAGAFGIAGPNATFSSFPLGMGPDYSTAVEINSGIAWYFQKNQALVGGLGYSFRNIAAKGVIVNGTTGNGNWAAQFLDMRGGYRFHSDIWFLEVGLLAAVNFANTPLSLETTTGTLTSNEVSTRSYGALYGALGAHFPIHDQLFGLVMARVDHGITPAVKGNAATATNISGTVISSAPLSVLLLNATIQIGVSWRL